MARTFAVEDEHAEEVLDRLGEYEGLEHVRARRRGDLLTLESGSKDDVVPHTRFRRVGVHRWQIEMPLQGGGWDRTPLRAQLVEAVDLVIAEFPWMLARADLGPLPVPDAVPVAASEPGARSRRAQPEPESSRGVGTGARSRSRPAEPGPTRGAGRGARGRTR